MGYDELPSSCSACCKLSCGSGCSHAGSQPPTSYSYGEFWLRKLFSQPLENKVSIWTPPYLDIQGKNQREKESRKEREVGEKENINIFKTEAGSMTHVCQDNTRIQKNLLLSGA